VREDCLLLWVLCVKAAAAHLVVLAALVLVLLLLLGLLATVPLLTCRRDRDV
jgi:hypothetical protein